MRFNQTPKKTDRAINFSSWDNINRQVKKLQNIKFDPFVFQTIEDPSGIYVTTQPSNTNESHDHNHRWTISNVNASSISVDTGTIGVMGKENAWTLANVAGLCFDNNTIYGLCQRDGGGSITMHSNCGSMPTQSELGNENFGFPVGAINCQTGVITQYIHSDFLVQFPKEHMYLYKVIAMREYDEDGVIVDIGDETDPLPAGHYYEQSVDFVRAIAP